MFCLLNFWELDRSRQSMTKNRAILRRHSCHEVRRTMGKIGGAGIGWEMSYKLVPRIPLSKLGYGRSPRTACLVLPKHFSTPFLPLPLYFFSSRSRQVACRRHRAKTIKFNVRKTRNPREPEASVLSGVRGVSDTDVGVARCFIVC